MGGGFAGQDDGTGAVVESRRVARRHLRGVGHRWKRGQPLGRGVPTDPLVVLKRPTRLVAGGRDVDGVDLGRQPTRIAGCRGMLMRAQGESVDLLSGQLVAVGHVLCRLDHRDVGVSGEKHGVRWSTGAGPHGVEQEDGPARAEGCVALHLGPLRARHGLNPGCQTDTELVAPDGMGDVDGAGER